METLKAISLRQSTRKYTNEQIKEEDLNVILEAGCAAPVGHGQYKSLHLTVIQNPELLKEISENSAKFFNREGVDVIYNVPTLILVSSTVHEQLPAIGLANASCIIQNMSLAATDLGLGNVYFLGPVVPLSKNPELVQKLNLPEGFVPTAALGVGYPVNPIKERANKHHIETSYVR